MSSAIPSLDNMNPNLIGALRFMGKYEPNAEYDNGDVVMMSGNPYVYITSTGFEPLVEIKKEGSRKVLPLICKCCGAPLRDYKCDYCGVEYG